MLLGTASFAQSDVRVSVDFFHDSLDAYGDWREVGDYGYCWQPREVDANWRPYSDGRWLYTDAGWTWDSDEPYSWAVYHYGRWARIDRIGWVWVPATEWGPAWVSWRGSRSHIGWAPLPPDAEFSRSVGFDARVDASYDIGPTSYTFVDVRNFGAPRLRTVLIEPREDIVIFGQTTNITRITYVDDHVYNDGPQYDVISRESAQPIPRLKLERRAGFDGNAGAWRGEQLRPRVEGSSLRVVAIPFDSRPATAPRKVAARVDKAEVDRGWKNAGPPAEVTKLRTRIKNEPAAAVETPPKGRAEPTIPEPAASTTPTAPAKPVVRERAVKPGESAPDAKPVTTSPQVSPTVTTTGQTEPVNHSKKGGKKGSETPRPPAGTFPETQARERAPLNEKIVPPPIRPTPGDEAPRETIRPGKSDAPPKSDQPAARSIERKVPHVPESRPEAKKPEPHEQVAPMTNQPQPAPHAKEKAKEKGKDEKKDEKKPEGTPQ